MGKKFAVILVLWLILGGCRAQPTIQTQPLAEEPTVPPFAPVTVVDNEHCSFVLQDIDPQGTFGYTLEAVLENKTELELMFSLRSVSVNGYMCDPFFAAAISPGMTSREKVSFLHEDLADNGITQVTQIVFTLAVYDNTDLLAKNLVEKEFTIYPQRIEAHRETPRAAQPGDLVLFSNESCAMVVTGFDPESLWGYGVDVYLENRTDRPLMFATWDGMVNGIACDPCWAVEVAPGKRYNGQISWMTQELEEAGIFQVEQITLTLRVYDSENWQTGNVLKETVTLEP